MNSTDWPRSVKDRLEDQLRGDVALAVGLDLANVQRYEQAGNRAVIGEDGVPPEAYVVVAFSDEDEQPEEVTVGFETLVLPFTIDVHLVTMPGGGGGYATTAAWANAWVARVKRAVMSNRERIEGGAAGGGEALAMETFIDGTAPPMPVKDQSEQITSVDGRIGYRHVEGDPYTAG